MNYINFGIIIIASWWGSLFGETEQNTFISASQVDNSFVEYSKLHIVKNDGQLSDTQTVSDKISLTQAKAMLSKNIITQLSNSVNKSKDLDEIINQISTTTISFQNQKNEHTILAQQYLQKYEECKSQKTSLDAQFYQELNNGDITKARTLLEHSAKLAECIGFNRVNYNGLAQIANTLDAYNNALENKKTALQTYYNTIITQTDTLDQITIDKLQTTINDLNATTLSIDG